MIIIDYSKFKYLIIIFAELKIIILNKFLDKKNKIYIRISNENL
jgi:hypothetical protein